MSPPPAANPPERTPSFRFLPPESLPLRSPAPPPTARWLLPRRGLGGSGWMHTTVPAQDGASESETESTDTAIPPQTSTSGREVIRIEARASGERDRGRETTEDGMSLLSSARATLASLAAEEVPNMSASEEESLASIRERQARTIDAHTSDWDGSGRLHRGTRLKTGRRQDTEKGEEQEDVEEEEELFPSLRYNQQSVVFSMIYASGFGVFALYALVTYFRVYAQPLHHSKPPFEVPKAVLERSVIYESSDLEGTPAKCFQGSCGGAWKPLRSRHCKDCGLCKFDSCITLELTMKPFLQFVTIVPLLLTWALIPLVWPIGKHLSLIVRTVWLDSNNQWMKDHWWSLRRSWIGGPGWRWMGGLYYSFKYATLDAASSRNRVACPSFSAFFLVFFATITLSLSTAMLYSVIWQLECGITSVEYERTKLWRRFQTKGEKGYDPRMKLWVPFGEGQGCVMLVSPSQDLYNRGVHRNWRSVMGVTWRDWLSGTPSEEVGKLAQVNEKWQQILLEMARKQCGIDEHKESQHA
ncbi:hypothetical protein BT69DRAFT_1323682 [Atractiella rhizophila]|nr:hypothetical protein BT69DRAFT_1323682 [Atractiella rhizophila]